MGMGERKKRAKGYQQQTDKAVGGIKEQDLFSNKAVEEVLTFECFRIPEDAPVARGRRVKLIDMRDRIEVFSRMRSVGQVVTDQVEAVRSTLHLDQQKGRSISATVIDVSDLTPTFVVQVKH